MADAKIVDIKGVQWELKDEVARNKITGLEQKTTVKITNKINDEKIIMNLVEINDEKFLQLHLNGVEWSGNIGDVVARFTQDFGLSTIIRCTISMDTSDGVGRFSANLDIEPDGEIRVYPYTIDRIAGFFRACRLYSDVFIKVI